MPDDRPVAVELLVEALTAGGRGLARRDGLVWFVPGTVPGDRVRARVRRSHRGYVEGLVVERVAPSELRRQPPCAVQEVCGGCPWMGLDEDEQRRWKRRLVRDALERIAGFDVEVEEVRWAEPLLGYRNKVEFTLGRDPAGQAAIGLHTGLPGSRRLVDVARCVAQADPANAVLTHARGFLLERADSWGPAAAEPWRLVLRTSSLTGQVLVALRETARPFPHAPALAESLRGACPEVAGVVRLRARPGGRGGARTFALAGRTWLPEKIGDVTFRLPAASFLQVNPAGARILLALVREAAGPVAGVDLIDLYGGVGAQAIDLAGRGARATVCEADIEAVRAGRRAARRAGRDVRFVHAGVSAFLRRSAAERVSADLVVANPPRSGLGRRDAEGIAALGVRRVILVSCDPATLARDARRLERSGYRALRAVPVDLFPQTAHVETVVTFERVASAGGG